MRRTLFCLFSIFLHSNEGIPKGHESHLRFGIRSYEDFTRLFRAKRDIASSSIHIPQKLYTRDLALNSNYNKKGYVLHSKTNVKYENEKDKTYNIKLDELNENRILLKLQNTKTHKNKIHDKFFHVNIYGDGTDDRRKQSNNSETHNKKSLLNYENNTELIKKHRSKRSPTQRLRKNRTFTSKQEETTAFDFRDIKAKIMESLARLDTTEAVQRSRRQSNKIKAVINDPDLRKPEPYVTPPSTPLPGCCTMAPAVPPDIPEYLNMTGDHMNIYPEAPEWGYPEVDRTVPTMRPWWYYNQDDYQQLKPRVPDTVMRT